MPDVRTPLLLLNGQRLDETALRPLALANFGHFTVMQVRNRAAQGLDFHLRRLQYATRRLFDVELDEAALRRQLRQASQQQADGSLRITVFSSTFDHRQPQHPGCPDVLVSQGPPAPAHKPPMRVKSFDYTRPFAELKHVATFPLFQFRREALAAGFDDALFVAGDGAISEGSVWNLVLWDGREWVWPIGPALRGSAEYLVQQGLAGLGIGQRHAVVRRQDLPRFAAAFATNASGIQQIDAIDEVNFGAGETLLAQLRQALQDQPWQPL
ncbi:aminotransferase class IV [Pseudoxanthomonas dokdonensis]|uniref:Aminotransferase n=1 Tax=Pseudoxanthomonas dokdonensis TaxID=344882 RepID=A0A0R0CGT5_9GAMM|nr:aminotransferase class IV [Pseudoxanthomonas dokdonensis]KRG68975.1 hypothetical protein ABB29_11055 [Pseudoxanthomonas dokdonensis]